MRPLGVTLAAYFQFLRGALIALLAVGVLLAGSMASRLASIASEGNILQRFLAGFGHFIGVALFGYAAIQVVLGIGLLLRQNWARSLTMIFCALGILLLIPKWINLHPVSLLFAALNLASVIYLTLPQARRYFENSAEVGPAKL